jgi:ABC-2 type transport system ATP-binding protein/lipopolysaccharide transport system ATP-binding protein
MMERDTVVKLENVGVRYRIVSERVATFKEYMIRRFQGKIALGDFWALRGVDLDIGKGEMLGLIGPNGAGKSTLLKLVARVMRPTKGRVWVKGVVAPLLEFGAGFHPDLTGRENIFLNGALLGFTNDEMQEKFDRIVDFAELWDFIDVPVRNYSSGMAARLGFAVATDIDPDILILDEVLSVGDESFQHKSLAKMEEFRDHGATIILVSHNMDTISDMCHRAVWLDHGQINMVGETKDVVSAYQEAQVPSED